MSTRLDRRRENVPIVDVRKIDELDERLVVDDQHVADRPCLSQWWPARFSVGGFPYGSAEHYMMVGKARLFGDTEALERILAARSPAEAKNLGREVGGFEEGVWDVHRFDIAVAGNVAKFEQDPGLREYLVDTRDRVLVEASPLDRVWGIGLRPMLCPPLSDVPVVQPLHRPTW